MEGESNLAKRYADTTGEDFDQVLKRWDGSPDKIVEDLFRVRNLDTGDVEPLKLFYPYQHKALYAYFYGDSTTINVYKGRRIGFSFIFSLAIFLDALANPGTFYPIVSVKKETAQNRIEDIYDLIDMCVLDVPLDTENKGEIVLWNGSTIEAFSGGVDSDRGADPARTVFIDEMAFLDDQADTMRVFRPFISLGEEGKFLQVSTPKVDNDLFMETHRDGTETGYADENGNSVPVSEVETEVMDNGQEKHYRITDDGEREGVERVPVSIKQPSFKDAENINIHESLLAQGVEPVRPDMDIEVVEDERSQDPEGFAQEYLCRPISDEYRFFSKQAIERAQKRGEADHYTSGLNATPQYGGTMVMGADIGVTHDDTVLAVYEHCGDARRGERYLRYWEIVDEDTLTGTPGINGKPDRANGNHLAQRMAYVANELDVEHVIYDETGVGQFVKSTLKRKIGRGVHPFNFTDKEAVRQMAHDLNYSLRNDNVSLLPSETMARQLESVIKKKDEDYQTAKFSGKEYAPDGKDDVAMALILGAYPSMLADDTSRQLEERERDFEADYSQGTQGPLDELRQLYSGSQTRSGGTSDPKKAFTLQATRSDRRYNSRHGRSQRGNSYR